MNTGSSKNNTDMPTVGKTDHPNTVEPAAGGKRKGYTVGYQSLLNTETIDIDLHPESYPPELVEFIKSWEEKANEMFKTWHGCMWYVKFAGIQFRYKGRNYMLTPCGFGDGSNEFFEAVALNPGGMEQALADFGAEEVFYTGMLD